MPFSLTFDQFVEYDTGLPGITVQINLVLGARSARVAAKIDTGATDCIFNRSLADELGLVVEDGERVRFATATGGFWTYRHEITLGVLGNDLDTAVYFAEGESFTRNVFGRHGFLDRTVLGLVDYDGRLYLKKYA